MLLDDHFKVLSDAFSGRTVAVIVVVALSFFMYFMSRFNKDKLPKALVLDDLDAIEDANKKAKELELAKKEERKKQRMLKKEEKKKRNE